MNEIPDVYTVNLQHVQDAAARIGFEVLRKPAYYIILCDALSSYGDAIKFPDNPHGYTEALAWLREVTGDEENKKP